MPVLDEKSRRALGELVSGGGVAVLSGAGLSTESGIPDYRTPDGTRRITPMTIAEFRASADNRRRYWARSFVGWQRFSAAEPNRGHRAVSQLQEAGFVRTVITQNVDGLHQRAGTHSVIELHGNLDRAACLRCDNRTDRRVLQQQMADANPALADHAAPSALRPDGDVDLPATLERSFRAPLCPLCGSDAIKPDVVMFGESVAPALVDQCFAEVSAATAVLVLGSSLTVMSGFRFVRRAADLGIPVAIVTHGHTRGHRLAQLAIDAPLGTVLSDLASAVTTGRLSSSLYSG